MVSVMSWRARVLVSAAIVALSAGMAWADGERPDEDHEVSITCCIEPGDEPVKDPGDDPVEDPGDDPVDEPDDGSGDDGGEWAGDDTGEGPDDGSHDWTGGDGDTPQDDDVVTEEPATDWGDGSDEGGDGALIEPVVEDVAEGLPEHGGEMIRPVEDCMTCELVLTTGEDPLPLTVTNQSEATTRARSEMTLRETEPDRGAARRGSVQAVESCLSDGPLAPLMTCVW
jgi:hypothetical protein